MTPDICGFFSIFTQIPSQMDVAFSMPQTKMIKRSLMIMGKNTSELFQYSKTAESIKICNYSVGYEKRLKNAKSDV